MTDFQEFTFLSSDGHTRLHGAQWTPADREPIAVLQIAHGVAEHILRYDDFARYLNDRGILVAGHDHLGHGKSLPEGGTPVYFGDGSTWETVVDDIHLLHDRLREQYPDLPILLMGHSMGSFLSRSYLIRYPGTVDAAIIMGTGWQPEMTIRGGLLLAGILSGLKGPDAVSKMVTNMAFGPITRPSATSPGPPTTGCPPTRTTWTGIWRTPCAARTPRWACSARCCGGCGSTRPPGISTGWTKTPPSC